MMLALKLHLKYGSLVNTYLYLSMIWADAPTIIRALAQEDRLQILKQILKTSDSQTLRKVRNFCYWIVVGISRG